MSQGAPEEQPGGGIALCFSVCLPNFLPTCPETERGTEIGYRELACEGKKLARPTSAEATSGGHRLLRNPGGRCPTIGVWPEGQVSQAESHGGRILLMGEEHPSVPNRPFTDQTGPSHAVEGSLHCSPLPPSADTSGSCKTPQGTWAGARHPKTHSR